MTKNPAAQGETKSSPPEIPKLARFQCERCGMFGPAVMIAGGVCLNVIACRKRETRRAKASAKVAAAAARR